MVKMKFKYLGTAALRLYLHYFVNVKPAQKQDKSAEDQFALGHKQLLTTVC